MNLVSRNGSRVVIRQIPFLLLFVTAMFSLPFLAFSLVNILAGTDADGKIVCLFLGLLLLWLFLEFVATREKIEIDPNGKILIRTVSGVFRRNEQKIDLSEIKAIVLDIKRDTRGRKRQHLNLYGSQKIHPLNSPAKMYLNHGKLGKLLSEATQIPYRVQDYSFHS